MERVIKNESSLGSIIIVVNSIIFDIHEHDSLGKIMEGAPPSLLKVFCLLVFIK
jgi:hypothetical protein